MNSPFSDRGMITDPSRFFGRKVELQKIFNALASPTPQCVSIIGQRRIGRSSLLWHVLHSYAQHLPQSTNYHFAYLDLSRDTCRHPRQFYAEVAQAFSSHGSNSLSPQQFDDWLADQNPQRTQKYILLLDEFNVLQRRRKQFDDDFYDGLRSRANAGEMAFVLATHVPLDEIALENDFSSTFFGIFTPVFLQGFPYEEAKESILRPATPPLRLVDFDAIRHWTRNAETETYHPLKVNIAADHVWQAMPEPNHERLKTAYQQTVNHVFGKSVHNKRRRQLWKSHFVQGWCSMLAGIHWITGEKPYLILIFLAVVFMLILGIVNLDQIVAALSGSAGIPTLTPTPAPTSLLTPTP
ncbi:MAG: hypothetical protein CL608_23420 [Anaerolineaceae bacterium]|nr:hypothetical protein [Anaerolineaceae bacterium]